MPTGPLTNFPNGVQAGAASTVPLAGLNLATQELTATGAVNAATRVVFLNHATVVIAATLAAPKAGDVLVVFNSSASGTAAHTVTLPTGVTWNGTNLIATLNAPGEALVCIAVSATRYAVLVNTGAVAFS